MSPPPEQPAAAPAPSGGHASVRGRVLRALGAGVMGQGIAVVMQLVSVPLFLSNWGTALYGEWLILSALPTYLAMSDVGFAVAAGNDMAMRVARGDRDGALEVYQSVWVLTGLIAAAVSVVAVALAWLAPLGPLGLRLETGVEARLALSLLAAHVILGLQASVLGVGLRSTGFNATSIMFSNGQRVLELGALAAAALLSRSVAVAAAAFLLSRVAGLAVSYARLRRLAPWLRLGSAHARLATIRALAGPAVTFMAFPLGHAIGLLGMVSVVGVALGPLAVPVLTTHRTLGNIVFSMTSLVSNSIWPEMSAAVGSGNEPLARALHRRACQAATWAGLAAGVVLLVVGGPLLATWTRGKIDYLPGFFGWVLAAVVVRSLWYTSSVVLMATNRHQAVARWYVAVSGAALLLAAALLRPWGLPAVGVALCVIDACMLAVVLPRSLKTLQDTGRGFMGAVARPPTPGALLGLRKA